VGHPTRKSTESPLAGNPAAARGVAIRLLARRDFASGELRARLERKGVEPAVAAGVIAELVEERALDDARYVKNYVSYHADRGEGPLKIAAALKALGLPADLVDNALAEGPDWRSRARQVRVRRFGPEVPPQWREKARQARFLQYRGFSSDHIRAATDVEPDTGFSEP
jgi:regulatory protein